jgi:hypothetical protein
MIGFMFFIMTILVIGLGILGVAAGLKRIGGTDPRPEIAPTRLDQIETMLSSMESRLDDLHDQQRFLERLLEARPAPPAIGAGPDAGDTRPAHGNAESDDSDEATPERSILFDTEPEEER